MAASVARQHAEWLSLLDISGPFLSLPVLLEVFPNGLDKKDQEDDREVRDAFAGQALERHGTHYSF